MSLAIDRAITRRRTLDVFLSESIPPFAAFSAGVAMETRSESIYCSRRIDVSVDRGTSRIFFSSQQSCLRFPGFSRKTRSANRMRMTINLTRQWPTSWCDAANVQALLFVDCSICNRPQIRGAVRCLVCDLFGTRNTSTCQCSSNRSIDEPLRNDACRRTKHCEGVLVFFSTYLLNTS